MRNNYSYVVMRNSESWSGNEWMGGNYEPVAVFSTKVEATKYANNRQSTDAEEAQYTVLKVARYS